MYKHLILSCRLIPGIACLSFACLSLTSLSPAVQAEGCIQAWGANQNGELGNGAAGTDSNLPVTVAGAYIALSAGPDGHSLVLKSDGTVWGWGMNDRGQLGSGGDHSATPHAIAGLKGKFIAVSAGNGFSLALNSDGTVWAWGNNDSGQLGIGTVTNSTLPVNLIGLANVTAISAGYYHSMALTSAGKIFTWGSNTYGELGNNTTVTSLIPIAIKVSGDPEFSAIAAGTAGHSLALTKTGTIYAWGHNEEGECGDGQMADLKAPTKIVIAGNPVFTAISAGASGFSMALDSAGAVWTWGGNSASELGTGPGNANALTPVKITGLSNVIAISAGFYHSVVAKSDGTVWAWGHDGTGQLGDQKTEEASAPRQAIAKTGIAGAAGGNAVKYVSGAIAVSAGCGYTEVLISRK